MNEDRVIIKRLRNAPERRVFYVDVGNISTDKAKDTVKKIMRRFRKKRNG